MKKAITPESPRIDFDALALRLFLLYHQTTGKDGHVVIGCRLDDVFSEAGVDIYDPEFFFSAFTRAARAAEGGEAFGQLRELLARLDSGETLAGIDREEAREREEFSGSPARR